MILMICPLLSIGKDELVECNENCIWCTRYEDQESADCVLNNISDFLRDIRDHLQGICDILIERE